jgi:hypothetical protein
VHLHTDVLAPPEAQQNGFLKPIIGQIAAWNTLELCTTSPTDARCTLPMDHDTSKLALRVHQGYLGKHLRSMLVLRAGTPHEESLRLQTCWGNRGTFRFFGPVVRSSSTATSMHAVVKSRREGCVGGEKGAAATCTCGAISLSVVCVGDKAHPPNGCDDKVHLHYSSSLHGVWGFL